MFVHQYDCTCCLQPYFGTPRLRKAINYAEEQALQPFSDFQRHSGNQNRRPERLDILPTSLFHQEVTLSCRSKLRERNGLFWMTSMALLTQAPTQCISLIADETAMPPAAHGIHLLNILSTLPIALVSFYFLPSFVACLVTCTSCCFALSYGAALLSSYWE